MAPRRLAPLALATVGGALACALTAAGATGVAPALVVAGVLAGVALVLALGPLGRPVLLWVVMLAAGAGPAVVALVADPSPGRLGWAAVGALGGGLAALVLAHRDVEVLGLLRTLRGAMARRGRATARELGEAQGDVDAELARARRYGRSLALVAVFPSPDADGASPDGRSREDAAHRVVVEQLVALGLSDVIAAELRRLDLLIEHPTRLGFLVISPETDHDGAERLVERLRGAIEARLHLDVACGIAEFPTDALTFGDLVLAAEQRAGGDARFAISPFGREEPVAAPQRATADGA